MKNVMAEWNKKQEKKENMMVTETESNETNLPYKCILYVYQN